jgi:hypothetical protein
MATGDGLYALGYYAMAAAWYARADGLLLAAS